MQGRSYYKLVLFYLKLLPSFSYALFDKDGNQVPQELVTKVGEVFETILLEVNYHLISKALLVIWFTTNDC